MSMPCTRSNCVTFERQLWTHVMQTTDFCTMTNMTTPILAKKSILRFGNGIKLLTSHLANTTHIPTSGLKTNFSKCQMLAQGENMITQSDDSVLANRWCAHYTTIEFLTPKKPNNHPTPTLASERTPSGLLSYLSSLTSQLPTTITSYLVQVMAVGELTTRLARVPFSISLTLKLKCLTVLIADCDSGWERRYEACENSAPPVFTEAENRPKGSMKELGQPHESISLGNVDHLLSTLHKRSKQNSGASKTFIDEASTNRDNTTWQCRTPAAWDRICKI